MSIAVNDNCLYTSMYSQLNCIISLKNRLSLVWPHSIKKWQIVIRLLIVLLILLLIVLVIAYF